MKLAMHRNSLFAILLRSPWWVSALIAVVTSLLAWVLLPEAYRAGGVFGGVPFVVIAALALRRQWALPSAARIEQTGRDTGAMAWSAFAALLEQAFRRDGYEVRRGRAAPVDFELERAGRRTLVSARRWKSARIGLEALRALQVALDASDATDAIYIGLGDLSDNARPFAAEHSITVWQAAELAQTLRGLVPRA